MKRISSKIHPDQLKELGYKTYRDYLLSDHWKDVKQRFFKSKLISKDKQGNFCCEGCEAINVMLYVHHKTYKRLGKEKLMDLVLLCKECHHKAHTLYKTEHKRNGLWRATKQSIRRTKKEKAKALKREKR